MSNGIWSAVSGVVAQSTALDANANNLANASTAGFKADTPVFREQLMTAVQGGLAVQHMRFAAVDGMAHDLTPGSTQETGRPLDVAIRGDGFFAVSTEAGERYTRWGSFWISASGELVNAEGNRVLGEAGRPISVPPDGGAISIGRDGSVQVNGGTVGRLRVVRFANQAALEREGQLLFRATEPSGAARVAPADLATGAVEGSNVSVVKGMTRIVSSTRTSGKRTDVPRWTSHA